MGFLSKAVGVAGILFVAAVTAEQSGVTDKFVPTEKKDLVGKYVNKCKELNIIRKLTNETWVNFKNNVVTKSKMNQIPSLEYDLISLNTEYEMFLEDKIEDINSTKKMLGDLFVNTTNIIKITNSMEEYYEKYKNILNRISELDSSLENKK